MHYLKKLAITLLILTCCLPLTCYSNKNHSPISCPYPLKQIYMCSNGTGWGLSMENEILYTENGIENLKPVKSPDPIDSASARSANAVFIDGQTAYITYFSSDNENMVVEYTRNGGSDWRQTLIKYKDYADAGSAFLSFADDKNGYLLYCSTPACGLMAKFLFVTDNAGETFTFAENLTSTLAGYPQGITAVSKDQIMIAVTFHGIDSYLYQSSDGAKTWENVEIFPRTDDMRYADGYAPIFHGDDEQNGMIILKVMLEDAVYKLFTTTDAGAHWTMADNIPCDSVFSYSISDDDQLYVVDQSGILYRIH